VAGVFWVSGHSTARGKEEESVTTSQMTNDEFDLAWEQEMERFERLLQGDHSWISCQEECESGNHAAYRHEASGDDV
jgi:hypothetical protein